jgi:hypothetical protein
MQKLIDANALKRDLIKNGFRNDVDMMMTLETINNATTIDAVPLDGSFLKMSRGDYLIYNRHWLYEHFGMERDIQRSAMKSMGYEPAIKDAEPHWIPVSERLPEKDGYYLTTTCYRQVYCDFWNEDHFDRTEYVIAWMPLPEPYEGDKE